MIAAPTVFAIDPALRSPGVAVMVRGEIVACDALPMPKAVNALPFGVRVDVVAERCVAWWWSFVEQYEREHPARPSFSDLPTIVYEKPQIYGGPQSPDPNDLMAIAMVAASVTTRMRLRGSIEIITPTPREWNKGSRKLAKNVPELWLEQRGALIARHLRPAERVLVPDKHDAVDAVGLALFAAGRLAGIRVNARPRVGG